MRLPKYQYVVSSERRDVGNETSPTMQNLKGSRRRVAISNSSAEFHPSTGRRVSERQADRQTLI